MANGPFKPVMQYGKENIISKAVPQQPAGFQGQKFDLSAGNAGGDGMYSYGKSAVGVSPYGQPAPLHSNRGQDNQMFEGPSRIVPIAALNPYQGRWTIKARVTAKGGVRNFNNAKGEGKVFHFDLLDAEGGEIRVICFNTVADRFHDDIELGKVYMISKGSLKPVQRNFNHLKNEWEIFLDSSSIVEECREDDNSVPQQQFDFSTIADIENMEGNAIVNVVGVVVSMQPASTVMRKNGTQTQKKSLQLLDASGRSVELTMWGTFCNREGQQLQNLCDSGLSPVVAVKGGRLSVFNGKSIGTVSSSQLLINPYLPQAFEVKEWFERVGKNTAFQSISKSGTDSSSLRIRKVISQIKDEELGRSEKPDWIVLKASISFLRTENFCYTACPLPNGDRQCNKKVISNGDGTWRCDRCDKTIGECEYRYLLSVQVQDHTGIAWITAFQEAGEELLGVTAKDLYLWRQEEYAKYGSFIQSLLFTQHLFKLKVKEENYNDEQRVKCTLFRSETVDYAAESKVLLAMVPRLLRVELENGPAPSKLASSVKAGPASGDGSGAYLSATHETRFFKNESYGGNTHQVSEHNAFGGTAYATQGVPYASYSGNGYGGNRYSSASVSCFKCGGDHFARDCPSENLNLQQHRTVFGGGYSGSGSNINSGMCYNGDGRSHFNVGMGNSNSCYKCGEGGHWARDCPGVGMNHGSSVAGNYGRDVGSRGCGGKGHYGNGHNGMQYGVRRY